MTPTDAQRLQLQFERNHWLITHRVSGKEMSKEDCNLIVAALTAAAEVGEREHSPEWHIIQATIERCAQVAENYPFHATLAPFRDIAAAIRALKDKP